MTQSFDPLRSCKGHFLHATQKSHTENGPLSTWRVGPPSTPKNGKGTELDSTPKEKLQRKKSFQQKCFYLTHTPVYPACTADHIWKVLGSEMFVSSWSLSQIQIIRVQIQLNQKGVWINSWYRKVIMEEAADLNLICWCKVCLSQVSSSSWFPAQPRKNCSKKIDEWFPFGTIKNLWRLQPHRWGKIHPWLLDCC